MDFKLALLFSIFGFCSPSLYNDRLFHYIDLKMSWYDAQSYCREEYNDLATIESEAENSKLQNSNPSGAWTGAWIGLQDDSVSWWDTLGNDANSWRWSHTGETGGNGYHNWSRYKPDNRYSKDSCVEMIEDGRWNDYVCEDSIPFACFSAANLQSKKKYFVITTPMTWKEAQTYCRTNYTDLAWIENPEDNQELLTHKGNISVWIGLYRNPWRWSDNRNSSYRHWESTQPNNFNKQYCTVINMEKYWEDYACGLKFPFWCQEIPKQRKIILMKIHSTADLSDPAINSQLLQQLSTELSKQTGQTVNLKWRIQPKKEEEEEEEEEEVEEEKPKAMDQCPAKVWQTEPPV